MDHAEEKIPILYQDKKECCGCGAYANICPRNAISMREIKKVYIISLEERKRAEGKY